MKQDIIARRFLILKACEERPYSPTQYLRKITEGLSLTQKEYHALEVQVHRDFRTLNDDGMLFIKGENQAGKGRGTEFLYSTEPSVSCNEKENVSCGTCQTTHKSTLLPKKECELSVKSSNSQTFVSPIVPSTQYFSSFHKPPEGVCEKECTNESTGTHTPNGTAQEPPLEVGSGSSEDLILSGLRGWDGTIRNPEREAIEKKKAEWVRSEMLRVTQ